MEYYGIIKEHHLMIKIAIIAIGGYMLYDSIILGKYYYLPIDIALILAAFIERRHVISEKGVDILYNLLGKNFHNLWTWDEIETIHLDYSKSAPNVEIHIGKGVVNRRFIFKKGDVNKALDIAKKQNSNIYIADMKTKKKI